MIGRIMSVVLAGFVAHSGALAQEMPASFVQSAYDKVAPAVCVVKYASEITNPNTGRTSRRNTRALGLLVSKDGLVMAHGHMQVDDSEPFAIRVAVGEGDNEKEYDARLLRKPEDVNVCFVQIETDEDISFPYVQFADRTLGLGEPLMLIGLLGDSLDFSRSVLVRRVGSIIEKPRTTYCIDERLLFGFVGSPVINARGEVVGVVGFDLSSTEGGELYVRSGHPLVYQTALYQEFIENPPSEDDEKPEGEGAFLGVFTQPLTNDLADYWGLAPDGGVVIGTIIPGSPAAAAGLQMGDVITRFDGVPVKAKQDREVLGFTKLVRDVGAGKTVPVTVLRDGEPVELTVTLAERPKSARDAGEFEDEVFGLTVREITTDVRILLNLSEDVQGVIVRRVKSGSWASLAEIIPGTIILNFGGHPVTNLDDYKAAVEKLKTEKPDEIAVFCRVGARTGFFRIQPRWENGTATQ